MPSSLMRKLNAMREGAPKPAARPSRPLIVRTHAEAADARLYSLPPAALRRLGYTGAAFHPERALFLDTETTGLAGAGTVAFLVGVGFVSNGVLTVRQYLMPDYAAEDELIDRLAELFTKFDTVVHFNGCTFDMPLLKGRFILRRRESDWKELVQLDLLKASRRAWKLRLGSCRLSSLEERILGYPREDDIPGAEIPARYFEAVKTGDLSGLEDVLRHNLQDIVTLTTLLCVLAETYAEPEKAADRIDLFSLGKDLERQGELKQARRLYHLAAVPRAVATAADLKGEKYAGEANLRLFHLYRRQGEWEKAEETLLSMLRRRQMGRVPSLELCKLYEHRLKRPGDALKLAENLLKDCPADERVALEHRIERLKRKVRESGGNDHGIHGKL